MRKKFLLCLILDEVCTNILKLRPIIDTTGTPRYSVWKFLKNNYLLCPPENSFNAVIKIKKILSDFFNSSYCNVSFDVETQFTIFPVKRTIDIILKQIFVYKVISRNLKKRSIKKFLLDT